MGITPIKQLFCEAFCAELEVRAVPIGFAVRTPYDNADGDAILLYIVRDGPSKWRIEDDGRQIPLLEANGVDISGRVRGEALEILLKEYGAALDKEKRTLTSPALDDAQVGHAAVRFVALLLRLQDLAMLAPHVVRSAFRDDALEAIRSTFDGIATLEESAPLGPSFQGHNADVVIRVAAADPVAVYLATSEERALQALITKMEAEKYQIIPGRVVLLLERAKANPVKELTYSLALNRLDGVVSFRESQPETMRKLRAFAGASNKIQ